MAFCITCGTQNDDNSTFCGNCGTKTKVSEQGVDTAPPPQSYQDSSVDKSQIIRNQQQGSQYPQQQGQQYPQQQGYSHYGYQSGQSGIRPPRTGWLTFVIVLNWISVVFIALGGLFMFTFASSLGVEVSFIGLIAVILFAVAGIIVWLTVELNKYNNTARIITIILAALGIFSLLGGNILGGAISVLRLYALAFHKETVALFKTEQRFMN